MKYVVGFVLGLVGFSAWGQSHPHVLSLQVTGQQHYQEYRFDIFHSQEGCRYYPDVASGVELSLQPQSLVQSTVASQLETICIDVENVIRKNNVSIGQALELLSCPYLHIEVSLQENETYKVAPFLFEKKDEFSSSPRKAVSRYHLLLKGEDLFLQNGLRGSLSNVIYALSNKEKAIQDEMNWVDANFSVLNEHVAEGNLFQGLLMISAVSNRVMDFWRACQTGESCSFEELQEKSSAFAKFLPQFSYVKSLVDTRALELDYSKPDGGNFTFLFDWINAPSIEKISDVRYQKSLGIKRIKRSNLFGSGRSICSYPMDSSDPEKWMFVELEENPFLRGVCLYFKEAVYADLTWNYMQQQEDFFQLNQLVQNQDELVFLYPSNEVARYFNLEGPVEPASYIYQLSKKANDPRLVRINPMKKDEIFSIFSVGYDAERKILFTGVDSYLKRFSFKDQKNFFSEMEKYGQSLYSIKVQVLNVLKNYDKGILSFLKKNKNEILPEELENQKKLYNQLIQGMPYTNENHWAHKFAREYVINEVERLFEKLEKRVK